MHTSFSLETQVSGRSLREVLTHIRYSLLLVLIFPLCYHYYASSQVKYVDGSSKLLWRVERPQLVFANDDNFEGGNQILALVNGVCDDGLQCLSRPGKTWTMFRPVGHVQVKISNNDVY